MTANEWLGVMKQAQDFPKGMEKLILKYGEMLIAEHESKVKKLNIPDVVKSLPSDTEIEKVCKSSAEDLHSWQDEELTKRDKDLAKDAMIIGAKWLKSRVG